MVNRFTETDKWVDPWFQNLLPEYKLAWLYFVDNCDVCGVIDLNRRLADFQIGFEVDWEAFLQEGGARFQRLTSGKIWIVRFVEFQQKTATLSASNNCHKGIISKFEKHGINCFEFGYFSKGLTSPTLAPSEPLPRGIGKGKGKGKSSLEEKKKGITKFQAPTAAEVNAYCKEKDLPNYGEEFVDYFESVGWVVGRGKKMVDWRRALTGWHKRQKVDSKPKGGKFDFAEPFKLPEYRSDGTKV